MDIFDILKITLPAILVLLTSYLLLDKMLKNDEQRRNYDLLKDSLATITPIRLRAYERLILVLERTSPITLIVNISKPGMTNGELHSTLLNTIREEFSHNFSQQIYISDEAWKFVITAQESLLRLVNTAATKCNPAESASQLAEVIIKIYSTSGETPTESAIVKLKNEVRMYFNN